MASRCSRLTTVPVGLFGVQIKISRVRPVIAPAIVADVDDHRILAIVECHDGRGPPGMLHGVGQGFLHNPVGREVEARRQRPRLPGDGELNRQAGGGDPVD